MKRTLLASSLALVIFAARLFAAAPVYSNNFAAVTLDGVRLGTDTNPSNYSMFPSVVYDSESGLFHMWVAATSALSIEGLRHATSADGVHFISDGNLSFAGGSPFPVYGAPVEPQFEFPRAAKVGTDWKLAIWTENGAPGQFGDYNYNESVNDIGVDPSTLAVTHQGPVYPTNGAGTFGQTTGPFGFVDGKLYVADDRPGGISKWTYGDTTPPSVTTPADMSQDLITGTGYVYFLTHPGDPLGVYVHNVGRVLEQGDGTLGVYYSLRHPDGSRVNQQIYYAQSVDDGQSWSAPVGIFANGAAIRVDGAANTFNFSHPEATLAGSRRVLYFSTKAADGQYVVATSAAQKPSPESWSDILASGTGSGESGVQIVRTTDGGYAVIARSLGLTTDPAFWLIKLDDGGEVVWQFLYTRPGAGASFFPTALAQAADGSFVMAGAFEDAFNPMWLMKVDHTGFVLWSKSYLTCDTGSCGNRVRALVATSDGGFAFAGTAAAATGTFAIGKVDGDGTLQWIHTYPAGATPSDAAALVETADGGLAAGGALALSGLKKNDRVLRTDSAGAVQWDRQIVSPGSQIVMGIVNADAGGLVVAGSSDSPFAQAVALDADGNIVWQRDYTGLYLGIPSGIAPSAAGGFGISGSAGAGAGTLLAIDGTGATLWAKAFAAQYTDSDTFESLVGASDGGFVAAGWDVVESNYRLLVVKVGDDGDFVGCLGVETSFPITETTPSLTVTAVTSSVDDETANTAVADVDVTYIDTDVPERVHCSGTLPQTLDPAALNVDPSGNGVADPGEQFAVEPSWTNFGLSATTLTGQTSAVSDSNGLDTGAPDPLADYGSVASLATADCGTATGDCYALQFLGTPRPSQHWDTYADETLTTSDPHHQFAKRWKIHAGLSFSDVDPSSGFYPFIENIFHNGITVGCGGTSYCPASSTTRAQMAVFLLKSKFGADHVPPPATGTVFNDVPADAPFAAWIEELAALGITGGCGGGDYCPTGSVTRQQMSAFLLKELNGAGYVPPPAVGLFGDVPQNSLFAAWIEDLYNRGITAGCSSSPLLYCPANPNTRAQMAVFLTKTFSLVLYGP